MNDTGVLWRKGFRETGRGFPNRGPGALWACPEKSIHTLKRTGEASRLARSLDRAGIGWDGAAPPAETEARTTNVPGALAPGERAALAVAQLLELEYDTGGRGVGETRQVQPLALEARDEHWYLRGTCQRQQAERTFRLDRIQALRLAS